MTARHFGALSLALSHGLLNGADRENQVSKNKRVGRIDLFCSMYLPYCDSYITNDDEQRRGLTEISVATKLPVEVLSFTEFELTPSRYRAQLACLDVWTTAPELASRPAKSEEECS
jgi:hypothetical protein